MSIQSGFMEHGVTPSKDTVTRTTLGATETDNRKWTAEGVWTADGTKLTTSTARTSDPRITVRQPFADFDMRSDVGNGDALYLRYKDANNWIRVVQWQTNSSYTYDCNPYTYYVSTGYTACNPYTCYYVSGYQACNPHGCGTYYATGSYYACGSYDCSYYYTYYYNCNCTENGYYKSDCCGGRYCTSCPMGQVFSKTECYSCTGNCYFSGTCPYNCYNNAYYNCQACGSCWVGNGTYTCQSCSAQGYQAQTCTSYCPSYAENTCYDTCAVYSATTCYNTCETFAARTGYETCTGYNYPVYLRVEKYVNGVLSTVGSDYSAGESAKATWLRATGSWQNIKIYSSRSPSNPVPDVNVSDHLTENGFGVGRVGYGNQDAGNAFDNIVIKPFGQLD